MVEANPTGSDNGAAQQEDQNMQQTFEQILQESGYSSQQVRNIANQLAENRAKKGTTGAAQDDADMVASAAAAATVDPTPQTKPKLNGNGGVNTNDETTVKQYFSYYAKLVNQQNMMEDTVRTPTYRSAILDNPSNFRGKVVMDVGCGSGILSIFAAQAGARKVYACEASGAAEIARILIKANGF